MSDGTVGYCYLFVGESMPWQNASDHCSSRGGHLVSIENEEEDSFVYCKFLLTLVF